MTRRSARITAVANHKGGVGKTTTAVNLAALLALEHRRRVLLVDLDPQGSATACLVKSEPMEGGRSLAKCLSGGPGCRTRVQTIAVATSVRGLQLVPASPELAGLEIELAGRIGRETILKEILAPPRRSYDHIVLDTSPALGTLTLNALAAADDVIVPVECQYLALRGLAQFLRTIEEVRQKLNRGLAVLGVLPTKFARRYRSNREVLSFLQERKDLSVLPPIPRDVRAEESPSHRNPLVLYKARSRATEGYRALAREVAHHGK